MKKLLAILLTGLLILTIVGCGKAKITTETVLAKHAEATAILEKDLAIKELCTQAELKCLEFESEPIEITEEEIANNPEVHQVMRMSINDIKTMTEDELLNADFALTKVIELGTNKYAEIFHTDYCDITVNTYTTIYGDIISNIGFITNSIVNELDTYKMHPQEMIGDENGWMSVQESLTTISNNLNNSANEIKYINDNFVFEDKVAELFINYTDSFAEFVELYMKEPYPRTVDSQELQNVINELRKLNDEAMMMDYRTFEGMVQK
ncbi:hypothetical protein ACV3K4_08805 [Clostridium perfringens]|uniref:hypothetical protein n=1 Tax=Clostridium perfringens TaxID=1502 RepID=UPI000E4ECAA6|nr:hypothetical protein [Clostridium perfringens]RHN26800.1 hypothetical protein DWZ20_07720 [Clostridium perfringens]